ncbi:MAG: hypothetical protein SRB2_01380 [Desulfobacteraceae bacterium Eth-SRB2]|nr:MAG: hypothetical protein SRB2_01380 [Desulfobacteraceae bacterium Eth-SRB2]
MLTFATAYLTLEGAQISQEMIAKSGAIEGVSFDEKGLVIRLSVTFYQKGFAEADW